MKKRILIVDDEKAILKLCSKILEQENREIHIVSSGFEALKLMKDLKFDLILLDLKMPGMDGTETFRELRKMDQDVFIYFMTAFQGEFLEKLNKIQKDGLSFEILNKPVEKQQLLAVVEGVLERSAVLERITGMIRLYTAGQNKKLNEAFEMFQNFLNENSLTHYEYEIIDIIKNPIAISEANVFATPTIVKVSPTPSKKIVGDISNPEQIAAYLGLL